MERPKNVTAPSSRRSGRAGRVRLVVVAAVVAAVAGAAVGTPATAQPDDDRGSGPRRPVVVADPAGASAVLAGRSVDAAEIGLPTRGAIVQSATLTPAGSDGTPEFCLVRGQVLSFDPAAPPINFQLNLPSTWERRTMQLGGGGFNGTVITGLGNVPGTAGSVDVAPATPLQRNYATFGGDSGNAVGSNPPGSFGLNAESFANYAGESVKRTRDAAQFLIRSYYGVAPGYQYFAGGSKGGHEALVAAQRYADDYDGIIAYYPANQNLFLIYGWDNLLRLANEVPGGALSAAEQQLVSATVMAACDRLDGVADGVIANRNGCDNTLHLGALLCPGGGDTGDNCLSAAQIDTMLGAAAPVELPYPAPSGRTDTGPFPALHGGDLRATLGSYTFFNTGVIRYWYLQDPNASADQVANFNWIVNRPDVERVTYQYDATSPDIDRFLEGGGKLIIVQGTTDMLVPPSATDPYYESLVDRYGRRLRNSVRYYVQPGYGHGNGAFNLSYDSLTTLDEWVARGARPRTQIAYDGNPNPATAGRSMPLCEYPEWPRYNGRGDPNSARSYSCVDDTRRGR